MNGKYEEETSTQIPSTRRRSWFQRTFSTMLPGNMRGNILLLTMATTGMSFTMCHAHAKNIGLFFFLLLLWGSGVVSYVSNMILYQGFKYTKAKTYDECISIVLGPAAGLISNIMVFLHTTGSVTSTYCFTFKLLQRFLAQVLGQTEVWKSFFVPHFDKVYYSVVCVILILFSFFGNIERLKKLGMMGLVIITYIAVIIIYQMPTYYQEISKVEQIVVTGFRLDWSAFGSFAFTTYLLINQYSTLPICNSLSRPTNKRVGKVVLRTTTTIIILYTILTIFAYFSFPNKILAEDDRIVITRNQIPQVSHIPLIIAIILQFTNLFIGMLVKTHFLLLYFH